MKEAGAYDRPLHGPPAQARDVVLTAIIHLEHGTLGIDYPFDDLLRLPAQRGLLLKSGKMHTITQGHPVHWWTTHV